jgi:hypothetical protein
MVGGVWGWMRDCAGAAVRTSRAIGFTALGASVVLGRALLGVLFLPMFGRDEARTPRHTAGRVREQVRAAAQAARAAGVIRHGKSRR